MANGIKIGNDNATYKVGSTDVSAIYLGNDLVYAPSSGLPSGYTQVEFVENQNQAYINTGFKPNQDTRIVAEMQCVTSTNSVMHFGAGGWDRVDGMWLTYETGISGILHVAWLGQTSWSTYGNGDYNKHTYDWNKNILYKDGTLVGSSTYGTYQCVNNLAIFANLQGEGNEYPGGLYMEGKLYSFKIYDNGTLVRNFIPCTRDSDSKAGVYDIVNNVFYSSANSGYELVAPQTGYTYSVTITGLENGDTTTIWWDVTRDIHTDSNVGNGTYTYTTTTDDIAVAIDTNGLSDYTIDYNSFTLYSGGSQTVTFTYQGGGGGLESIPYGTDMTQYYNRYIKRIVINDTTVPDNGICINQQNATDNLYGQIQGNTYMSAMGAFGNSNVNLPLDITPSSPVELTYFGVGWWPIVTTNPFNDLQIEWA